MPAPLGSKNRQGRVQRAVLRALARAGGTVSAGLDTVADQIVKAASTGEPWALQMLADRIDGRPHQSSDVNVTSTVVDLRDADTLSGKLETALDRRLGEPAEPPKRTIQ